MERRCAHIEALSTTGTAGRDAGDWIEGEVFEPSIRALGEEIARVSAALHGLRQQEQDVA